ncbi:hypothetical protein F1B92_02310 [Campylobacter sp. FMV-PI01]|uniref:Ferrochelatase n=1 Tax=Campylobacter portucalensis TaxID=2608384 RepID=A0A6L5WJ49_9BACT|nr:hypothetical protein [Campylobacter portucalensis]MSN96035.1 hypothetical protein [Campylobacter portucalensis]
MKIQTLVRILNAKLLNQPCISSVVDFSFDAQNIKQASAFITFDKSEIGLAIQNGAYAVIFEGSIEIVNDEIAYICVENLKQSILKLIKFISTLKDIKFIKINQLEFDIFRILKLDSRLKILDDDLKNAFLDIYNSKNNTIFISKNIYMLNQINISYENLLINPEIYPDFDSSIFYLNFSFKEKFYSIKFPQIFLKEIYSIFEFLDQNGLDIKLKDLKDFNHFEEIFIDNAYNVKQQSFRALIIESDIELFLRANEFLRHKFKNGIISISPKNLDIKSDLKYENLSDIKIKDDFRYMLILGDKKEILDMLNLKKYEKNLFDD